VAHFYRPERKRPPGGGLVDPARIHTHGASDWAEPPVLPDLRHSATSELINAGVDL